ncbi:MULTISPECIES: MerR family transcriptional regulator [unclassified Pantoea]|uniref:MerR family transcriptional regulator n=1 Tax=unclassified Pantoea TaxID=2630326 RepID=UPI00301BF850
MNSQTTETVCGMTGLLPGILRNWRRAGLVGAPALPDGYTDAQLTHIYQILNLTASGDALSEVRLRLNGYPAPASGWEQRRNELHVQLDDPSSERLQDRIRQTGSDYCGDDFVNCYLRPLNLTLRRARRSDAPSRQARFHNAVVRLAHSMINASHRRHAVPVFLEAVSVDDATEIWMEAIRLTGQGCRVEVCPNVTGYPASASEHHKHHLMWCGAGFSPLMKWNFRQKCREDLPVMLCGPDQSLLADLVTDDMK